MNTRIETAISMRRLGIISLLVAALGGGIMLVATSTASAQDPAICTQYPDLPQCDQPGGGGDDDDNGDDSGGAPVPGGGGPTADRGDAGGELPFTGYPLTFLILLLLILLLIGLAIRAYLAIRGRVAGNRAASP